MIDKANLRALFIDLSGKQWTAYIFNDWIKSEEGKWHNGTDQQNYRRLAQLIERLKVNYIVYERREVDEIPRRPEGQDGFLRYINCVKYLVNYCRFHKINGATIDPKETEWHIKQTEWCWRDPFLKKPRYCDRHQQEAPCNWYPDKDIPIKDEVDARAIYEIWAEKDFYNDIKWMRERERIHALPFKFIYRESKPWEIDKWKRLGTIRENDKENNSKN